MYENWKVSQEQMRTPSSSAGSESWEAEHPESEDPVWLYPGDDGWHEAAPIFVLGFVGDEETDEEDSEAEHPESEEDPVWLYPGDTGWHEAAPIFVIGYRDEETDEDDIREMEAFFDDDEVRANEELYDATD